MGNKKYIKDLPLSTSTNLNGYLIYDDGNTTYKTYVNDIAIIFNPIFVKSTGDTITGQLNINSNLTVSGITTLIGDVNSGNPSGVGNNSLGTGSLISITDGDHNTAFGVESLNKNTTGYRNVSLGSWSLTSEVSGADNTAVGTGTLYKHVDGNENTALGSRSLYNLTGGTYNVGVGYSSGRRINPNDDHELKSATGSTFLGYFTRSKNNESYNETVIGYNSVGNGNNTVTVGNSDVINNYFSNNITLTGTTTTATLYTNDTENGAARIYLGESNYNGGFIQYDGSDKINIGTRHGNVDYTSISVNRSNYPNVTAYGSLTVSGRTIPAIDSTFELGDSENDIKWLNVLSVTGTFGTLNIKTPKTPTGTTDSSGIVGDTSWDASYIYVKTGDGWKRSTLNTF